MNSSPPRSIWKPHVTVAAVCEQDGLFLMVRERIDGKIVFNQPAGHLDPGESLQQAVKRETLEETGYIFRPTGLVGIYRFITEDQQRTYLRFAFCGEVGEKACDELDTDILGAEWMTLEQIESECDSLRTPMVLQCILDYRDKPSYPLQLFSTEFA